MKQTVFTVIFILFALIAKTQGNNYFLIFDPNRDAGGEIMINSPEKRVIGMSCDITTMQAEDSIKCLEDVKVFDGQGRVTEHFDLYAGLERHYKYDDKSRVAEYFENKLGETPYEMKLAITYNKKGKMTAIMNTSGYAGGKSVAYYPKEEKMIISEGFNYVDEVYFKDGLITKIINKNSAEMVLFTAQYQYDKKGRVINQSGKETSGDIYMSYSVTTLYNADGNKVKETDERWDESSPAEKSVTASHYSYNEKGKLVQKIKKEPETQYLTVFEYDETGRLMRADYFDNEFLLVSMYYYYR